MHVRMRGGGRYRGKEERVGGGVGACGRDEMVVLASGNCETMMENDG